MHPAFIFVVGAVTGYAVSQSRKVEKNHKGGYSGQRALPAPAQVLALGPACSSWEIFNYPKIDLLVRKAYIDGRLAGITDPYKLTDRTIQAVAPRCHTPAKGIRNVGELDLYTSFFDSILALLADDFPEAQFDDVQIEFQVWHEQQAEVLGG